MQRDKSPQGTRPRTLEERLGPGPKTPPVGDRPDGPLPRILLVDDDETFIKNARVVWTTTELRDFADFEFFAYSEARWPELVALLKESFNGHRPFDTVYVDMNMAEGGDDAGIGLIQRLRDEVHRLRYIPFVVITAFPNPIRERDARERGAIRFIIKTTEKRASDIIGSFVHRMIFEARETHEQAEDQLWADASAELVKLLLDNDWEEACAKVLTFVYDNFKVKALYARKLGNPNVLEEIAAEDHLQVKIRTLNIANIPFLRKFIDDADHKPWDFLPRLTPADVGERFAPTLLDHHAAIARIGVGAETLGLLTMYRRPEEREFRKRDAEGLYRLASLMSAAITQHNLADEKRQEAERLRGRQQKLLLSIRQIDLATTEEVIWEHLKQAVFEAFKGFIVDTERNLKVVVRKIGLGSNSAVSVGRPMGFQVKETPNEICLENKDSSSIARAVWEGKVDREDNLVHSRDRGRFMFLDQNIRSALAVPALAQELCVGVVNLECRFPNGFSNADQQLVEVLVEAAAAAILRLRVRRLLERMTDIAATLAEQSPLLIKGLYTDVLRLLFDFTGCSEIIYLVPPEDGGFDTVWTVQSVFQRRRGEIVELSGKDEEKWNDYIAGGWNQSFVRHVLHGGRNVEWTQDPNDIGLDDAGMPGRGKDAKTRTQAVIVVRRAAGSEISAMVGLLIQHRHGMSDSRAQLLERLGSFLASLLWQWQRSQQMLGKLRINEQEARLGRLLAQMKHNLGGRLSLIRQNMLLARQDFQSWDDSSKKIEILLGEMLQDMNKNRALIKTAVKSIVNLDELWEGIRDHLGGVCEETQTSVLDGQLSGQQIESDPEMLRTILFNLVDNALRHGGMGTEVSAQSRQADGLFYIGILDSGKGIHPSVHDSLFEPMVTTTADSTGLGLYLSQILASDLGGHLNMIWSNETGTLFELSLPLELPQ